jgi:uncharacterized protein YaiI (UPF0178 family)
MQIWIDADACPRAVKEVVFRASARRNIPVSLVANRALAAPPGGDVRVVQVPAGSDVADRYIVEHVEAGDLVITADIPLAALVVERGAVGLDPRGDLYTRDTVSDRLATRNLLEELRWAGMVSGGPSAYRDVDRQRFSQVFHQLLAQR